ncbi:MAG: hypothetical protein K1X64_09455 [Myxococcaceae bacterium]|nr:hypothetical protein [Myxococcaceae bacterium]
MMPAHWFALAAGGVASWSLGEWTPLFASAGASALYLVVLSVVPSFRRAVRANFHAHSFADIASPEELQVLLADLAPSQRQHYQSLAELKGRILKNYERLPGGKVMMASSEHRLDALLTSFVRLLTTLNSYRKYLNSADHKTVEAEVQAVEKELSAETSERLRDVKSKRLDILRKRHERFAQAAESREVVSHQLATIEDMMRLAHEQSIAIRSPEGVERQLELLTAGVEATEETVREMEKFLEFDDATLGPRPAPQRVR